MSQIDPRIKEVSKKCYQCMVKNFERHHSLMPSFLEKSKETCLLEIQISLGNVHKGRPTIMGHFGHTYLPMSDFFYTMPITLVQYLPTYPKIGRPL